MPGLQAWRGVTVDTDAATVWPWLAQLQVAPYSYDWVDNLGRKSPRVLLGLPDPVPGAHFTKTAGIRMGKTIAVEHGVHLTGRILSSVMSYVLVPVDDSHTRLLMKIVVKGPKIAAPLISVGDLVMARKQLLTFKALAEGRLR